MKTRIWLFAIAAALTCSNAWALFRQTAPSTPTAPLNVYSDNGVIYFGGFSPAIIGACNSLNRLQLDETGDYWGHSENAKRMLTVILAAQVAGKAITLEYEDNDTSCRLAGVTVQW